MSTADLEARGFNGLIWIQGSQKKKKKKRGSGCMSVISFKMTTNADVAKCGPRVFGAFHTSGTSATKSGLNMCGCWRRAADQVHSLFPFPVQNG